MGLGWGGGARGATGRQKKKKRGEGTPLPRSVLRLAGGGAADRDRRRPGPPPTGSAARCVADGVAGAPTCVGGEEGGPAGAPASRAAIVMAAAAAPPPNGSRAVVHPHGPVIGVASGVMDQSTRRWGRAPPTDVLERRTPPLAMTTSSNGRASVDHRGGGVHGGKPFKPGTVSADGGANPRSPTTVDDDPRRPHAAVDGSWCSGQPPTRRQAIPPPAETAWRRDATPSWRRTQPPPPPHPSALCPAPTACMWVRADAASAPRRPPRHPGRRRAHRRVR